MTIEFPIYNEVGLKKAADWQTSGIWLECHVESACCLWECAIGAQYRGDESIFDWLRAGEGAACARQQCINLAKDCDKSYHLAVYLGYDTCFDWDFVPKWIALAMQITKDHDLTEDWINYIGMEIYREFRLEYPGVCE